MESSISPLTQKPSLVYTTQVYASVADKPMAIKSDLTVVHRGRDVFTVVPTKALSESADAINAAATSRPTTSNHTPGNASAIVIFHTQDGDFALSSVRDSPAQATGLTKRGTSFPKQIDAAIGGDIADPALPLKDSVMAAIKNKMSLNSDGSKDEKVLQAKELLNDLCRTIDHDEGWEDKVCVQAAKWTNPDLSEGKARYLTGIKHIRCAGSDLRRIEDALRTVMASQKDKGNAEEKSSDPIGNPRTTLAMLSPQKIAASNSMFKLEFVPFESIVETSLDSACEDELMQEHVESENICAVVLNDLTVTTFLKCNAFRPQQYADLVLPRYGATCGDVANEVHRPHNAVARTRAVSANTPPVKTVGRQINDLQQLYETQTGFNKLLIGTKSSLLRATDELDRKLAADFFIVDSHQYLSETDNPGMHNKILKKGAGMLNQIEPTYRDLPTSTLNRLRLKK